MGVRLKDEKKRCIGDTGKQKGHLYNKGESKNNCHFLMTFKIYGQYLFCKFMSL